MKRVHLRSIRYPKSGLSVCRHGTTASQLAALVLTDNPDDVTCKRCLRITPIERASIEKQRQLASIGKQRRLARTS